MAAAGVDCGTRGCVRHPKQWMAMQMFLLSRLPKGTRILSIVHGGARATFYDAD